MVYVARLILKILIFYLLASVILAKEPKRQPKYEPTHSNEIPVYKKNRGHSWMELKGITVFSTSSRIFEGITNPTFELEPRLTESCSPLQTQSMTKSFLCQGLDSKTWKNNGMFCGLTENRKNSRNVKASLLLQLYVYDDTDVITENKPLSLGYNSVILEARKWFKSSRMDNLDKRIYRKSEAVRNGNFKRKAGICERIIRDNLCPKIDNKSH